MSEMERVYEAGTRIEGIKLYAAEALQLWMQHADTEHSTPKSVYGWNIVRWHQNSYPDCGWDIGSMHWNDGQRPVRTGTDGIQR